MRQVLLGLMLALMTWAQGVAAQTPQRSDIIAFIGRLPDIVEFRQQIAKQGFRGAKLELMVAHMRAVLQDKRIAGHIADRLLAAGMGRSKVAGIGTGLIDPLLDRGLGHLPPKELTYFYQVEAQVVRYMSTRECGLAFKAQMGQKAVSRGATRVAARLDERSLGEYLRIQRKAAKIGVSRGAKRLSAAAESRTQSAVVKALAQAATQRSDGKALLRTMGNIEQASSAQACAAGRFFLDTVLAMPPKLRHDVLVSMSGA